MLEIFAMTGFVSVLAIAGNIFAKDRITARITWLVMMLTWAVMLGILLMSLLEVI